MAGRRIEDTAEIRRRAKALKRVAVVGIKPEDRAEQPAHKVPAYLVANGVEVVPVPTYYPDITEILGVPVVRDLKAVGEVDAVNLFRRSVDVPGHLDDILALKPALVWMQKGIAHDEVADALTAAGIDVIMDRCLMVEHREP